MKNRMRVALIAMAVTCMSLAAFAQDTPMVGGAAMYPTKNIVENASTAKNLTTLVAAVKAAGLVETLEGPGPFTVFAPTNEAFAKLPAGTVDTLLKPENKDQLTKILTYHVVAGKLSASDLMKQIKAGGGKAELKTVERRNADGFHAGQASRADRRQGRHRDGDAGQRLPVERRGARDRCRADAVIKVDQGGMPHPAPAVRVRHFSLPRRIRSRNPG